MKAVKQGARAFRFPKFVTVDGHKLLKGNPYPEDTDEYRQWQQGYNEAYYKNLQVVRKKEQNERSRAGG